MLCELLKKIMNYYIAVGMILSIIWLIYAIGKFIYLIVEGIFNYDKK